MEILLFRFDKTMQTTTDMFPAEQTNSNLPDKDYCEYNEAFGAGSDQTSILLRVNPVPKIGKIDLNHSHNN